MPRLFDRSSAIGKIVPRIVVIFVIFAASPRVPLSALEPETAAAAPSTPAPNIQSPAKSNAATVAAAGEKPVPAPPTVEIMPVDDVREGMKGVGRTVMHGTEIVEFNAEVLGVMKAYAPGRDLVLCRLSSGGLETSGVVAGMSGSPIYIDGKLLGAVAYAWPYAKEPIAGVTPIEQMKASAERPTSDGLARLPLNADGTFAVAVLEDVRHPGRRSCTEPNRLTHRLTTRTLSLVPSLRRRAECSRSRCRWPRRASAPPRSPVSNSNSLRWASRPWRLAAAARPQRPSNAI